MKTMYTGNIYCEISIFSSSLKKIAQARKITMKFVKIIKIIVSLKFTFLIKYLQILFIHYFVMFKLPFWFVLYNFRYSIINWYKQIVWLFLQYIWPPPVLNDHGFDATHMLLWNIASCGWKSRCARSVLCHTSLTCELSVYCLRRSVLFCCVI